MAQVELSLLAKSLEDAVTSTRGTTSPELRRKVFDRAAGGVRRESGPSLPDVEALVDAVATAPHRADIAGAMAKGLSEDAVFEIVVTAAVGAGYAKVEKALALIEATKE